MLTSGIYPKGQEVEFSCVFKNAAGALADPSTVTAKVIYLPTGTVTTYVYGTDPELVRDSTGLYHLNFIVTNSGQWAYSFLGSGTITTTDEKLVTVKQSVFP